MRICIIGAGAIGGLLAVRLAASGQDVTIVDRDSHLKAILSHGLRLQHAGEPDIVAQPRAVANVEEAGIHDLVLLGVKSYQLAEIAPSVPNILASGGRVIGLQNGIPWWYFMRQEGPHQGHALTSVDPGGILAANVPIDRVIGCVVYPAARIVAPGVIELVEGDRFSLAEIDNSRTNQIETVSDVFSRAGFKAPVVTDIRAEIWIKLWGNLSFNPISALTGATIGAICRHNHGRSLVAEMMREAQAVSERLGVRFRLSIEKRIAGAEAVGEHKTSMLQDLEAGRRTEVDALLGAVIEIGSLVSVHTPTITAMFACTKLLEDTLDRKRLGQDRA